MESEKEAVKDPIPPEEPGLSLPKGGPSRRTATAVLLMNYGGPTKAEECGPYLRNIFMDPDLIPIPRLIRPLVASLVARRRAPSLARNYLSMGQFSPTLRETEAQARALEAALGGGYRCFVGMRYWQPYIAEVCREISEGGFRRIVLLPVYPHESVTTTGSSIREALRSLRALEWKGEVLEIRSFWESTEYLDAMARKVLAALETAPERTEVLFSAHGLPLSVARKDPYPGQVARTVAEICERVGIACGRIEIEGVAEGPYYGPGEGRWPGVLAWQSKVGPAKWLGPSVEHVLTEWAGRQVPHAVVVPVAFVNEHSETLYELDVLYGNLARRLGLGYSRVPTLGTDSGLISALARSVQGAAGSAGEGRP
ncbi:MAG: ferrochelatase [Acidobacteriota bacterium]